jgi:hypothetical protein
MTRFTHCIVHAGTHKTGTTSLQQLLAERRSELAAAGWHYPTLQRKGRDHNLLAHRLATCGDAELPQLRALLARQATAPKLLLSAEELSTRIGLADPWAGFDDGAYWDRRHRYLARLRSVLADAAQIEVYLCFRDHEAYAYTLYATKLQSGKVDGSFEDFVRRCAPIFDYGRQAQVMADALGPVHAIGYDHLRGDLANRFMDWIGVPLRGLQAPRLRPTPAPELVHWLARAVQRGAAGDERKRRSAFCISWRAAADAKPVAPRNLWHSARQRSDFLALCRPPPLPDWPRPPIEVEIAGADALDVRAEQLEAEYQRWCEGGGGRKHWIYFWRRL